MTRSLMAVAAAAAVLGAVAPATAIADQAIEGQYVVRLVEGADTKKVLREIEASANFEYGAAVTGFAAALTDKQLSKLTRRSEVEAIEQDYMVTLAATQTMTAGGGLYGLDRVDQRALPFSGSYTYTTTASNVTAYIIDTGILPTHTQFGTRAASVYNSAGGSANDCNGHGTHVAGTVGGSTYGLAKGVKLRGVKVLACNGSGSYSGIIAGVDWVRANAVRPAVANMSLGGGVNSTLNTAVNNLSNSGVFTAVAAGNENTLACNRSPASASAAYTVAASDKTDTKASFSNYGSCVDGWAPGVSIQSAWHTSTTATNTISGTSMASPHVAGVAALYKGAFGEASSATVTNWLNSNATANVIRSNPSGTPNRLLFKSTL